MVVIKSYIFLATLLFSGAENSITSSGNFWQTDYNVAMAKAKSEDKVIMLYFSGSDWCKPCIIWKKEVFDTPTFQDFAKENLVTVKLDFPRLKKNKLAEAQVQQNEKLAGKYNAEGVFPMVVFIDKDGKVIEKSGYKAGGPEDFIEYTKEIIARTI